MNSQATLPEEDEDSQYEAKQELFEKITSHLTVEQKKGIIPIVFGDDKETKR